jgi:hypothetical protein
MDAYTKICRENLILVQIILQGDYKQCKRLRNVIGKKVKATSKYFCCFRNGESLRFVHII